ncbi:MAG TPA: hypothetical protein VIC29_06425 [Steroidobacteraceae bacterium]|jgi:hypothetical protein
MTTNLAIAAGLLLCAGVLPLAHADCGPVPQPAFAIPDGAHASKDEMSAARDNLSEYSAQAAAYASCLDAEQADAGRAAGDARRLRNEDLDRGSALLLQLASVVSCFSRQVQTFQATGGGSDAGPAQCSSSEARRHPVSFHSAARPSR